MLRLICGVAIVAFSTYMGYFCAEKYRKRKNFLIQLDDFNERFISELEFGRSPLKEFSEKYTYKGEFASFLNGYLADGGGCDFSFLSADEKNFVNGYFSMLGKGDAQSQKAFFTSVRKGIEDYKTESEADAKKYGELYLKLGFLAGLAVLVIIV